LHIALLSSATNLHTTRWVEFFTERGHEVHLLSIQHGAPICEHQYSLSKSDGISQLKVFRAVEKTRRLLKQIQPDVVLGQYLTSHGFLGALANVHPLVVVAWSPELPYVANRHAYDRWRMRKIFSRAELTLVCGRHLIDDAIRFGADERRLAATYVGIDPARFPLGKESQREPMLLFTNREFKDILHVDTIIRTLPAVVRRFPEVKLILANDGPLHPAMVELATELGVVDNCEFIGRTTQAETASYLRRAAVYVSCSEVDGMSISLLEAMSSGAYPVVSDIIANREILSEPHQGSLFPVNNHETLAEQLLEVLENPDLRTTAQSHNRELALTIGSREKNLTLIEERLLALVGGEKFVGESWRAGVI